MAIPNPTANIPPLPSPTKRRGPNSRSPSRSPTRYQRYAKDGDPLLRDFSPTSTLRAFSSARHTDGLNRSIETASQSERARAAKAAQACVDLRSWVREIEGWAWPGTFEVPEPVRKKQRMSIGSVMSRADVEEGAEGYWGSLTAQTVRGYERRMDEINEGLDELNVEELKDFVLSAHGQASHGAASIDDSIGTIGADTNLKRLDDFTALLTATILQALPYLSRLTRLLQTWTLRTRILRSTPQYLADLKQARLDLDHGWAALAVTNHPADDGLRQSNASFSRETMQEMKQVVSRHVASLGRRLDAFLDELEGCRDIVPERWIEEFEVVEEQYGSWVVQAERKVLEGEWSVGPAVHATTTTAAALTTNTQPLSEDVSSGPRETSIIVDQPRSRSSSPRKDRNRHTPIIIEDLPTQLQQEASAEFPSEEHVDASPLPPLQTFNSYKDSDTESQIVKKRAAFLNGNSDGLAKSKSPPIVRPFEHASNAFTRLFKRDSHPSTHTSALAAAAGAMPMPEDASAKSAGKRSSGSSKRAMSQRSGGASSQLSGGSSSHGSKGGSSRLENGDMILPMPESEKRRIQGRRGKNAKPVTSREKRGKMEYRDLVGVPEHIIEEELRKGYRRKKRDSREQPQRNMGYGDMVTLPERTSMETTRGRRSRARKDLVPERGPNSPRSSKSGKQDVNAFPTLLAVKEAAMAPAKSNADEPETHQPTGFGSPFHSPAEELEEHQAFNIPADWPLSNTATPRETPSPVRHLTTESIATVAAQRGVGSAYETMDPDDTHHADYFEDEYAQHPIPPQSLERPISKHRKTGERQVSFRDTPVTIYHHDEGEEEEDTDDGEGVLYYNERPPPDRSMMRTGVSNSVRLLGLEDSSTSRPLRTREAINSKRASNLASPGLVRPVSRVEEENEEDNDDIGTPGRAMPRIIIDDNQEADDEEDEEEDYGIMNGIKDLLDSNPSPGYFNRAKAFAVLGVPSPDGEPDGKRSNRMSNAAGYFGAKASDSPDLHEEEEYGVKDVDVVTSPGGYFSSSARASSGVVRPASSRTIQTPTSSMSPLQKSKTTPPVSPILKRLKIPTTSPTVRETDEAVERLQQQGKKGPVRRASATSIEQYPRSELRSIDVVRRGSIESPRYTSSPASPVDGRQSLDAPWTPTSPLHYKRATASPSPPPVPPRGSSLSTSPRKSDEIPELNTPMSKQKYKGVQRLSMEKSPPLKPGEDKFDRHVSEVLDRVHAPIRFKSRPGAETPQQLQQKKLAKASERPGKNMTLAPADPSAKKANSEVKLYHLTQAGRSEPIKLYVRLVGEGERVMVRVGGGWADLADYLRQYAEHHGSRTVSGGVVEVQNAAPHTPAETANGSGRRTFSGPVEPKARTPMTPISTFIPPLERPRSKDSERIVWLGEDQPRFTMGDSDNDDDDDISPTAIAFGTPRSTLSNTSRPSTAQSATASSRRDSIPSDLRQKVLDSFDHSSPASRGGLAGPSKIRADLPEQKARWVEGMIQQVNKSASAEKSASSSVERKEERQKYFGDLGRVGGTRRMVFRSSSGTGAGVGGEGGGGK